jgi:hypothetical protein
VYPFEDGSDVPIEMMEVGDQFDKAQIHESVLATNDTAIDFFFHPGKVQFVRQISHDIVHTLVEFVRQLLIHEIFVALVDLPDVIVYQCDVLEVLLVQLHHVRTLLLLLSHDRHRVQRLLVQALESWEGFLDYGLLVVRFEGVHEVGQSGQGLQGGHYLLDVPEEVVGDVQLYELFEAGEVAG